jgi:hypothetical protein
MKTAHPIPSFLGAIALTAIVVVAGCATGRTPLENTATLLPDPAFTYDEPYIFSNWLLKTPSLLPEPYIFRDTPYLSVPTLEHTPSLLPEPAFRSTTSPIFVK